MQKPEIVAQLPWLQTKPERAIFSELGFACVYAVGPSGGRPLRIGWSKQLKDRMRELQLGCWKELQIYDLVWTAGDMLAIRLQNEVISLFDKGKRRLHGDWFDVTPDLALQAIAVASKKTNIPTFSHVEMLDKVRGVEQSRVNAAMRKA